MTYQKVFKNNFIKDLETGLDNGIESVLELYEKDTFPHNNEDCLIDARTLVTEEVHLHLPNGGKLYSFENARIIFETFQRLPLLKAADPGLWTYLTHVTFWQYMKIRWPIEENTKEKRASFILEHWFVRNVGASDLARNGISSLWWGCYLTYDEKREDPYELTKELFSMLDFYRTLIGGIQGRNIEFTHAILEFVIENKDLFKSNKEYKVRFLMRRLNAMGGYKLFTSLSKDQIKSIFSQFAEKIKNL